MGRERPIDMKLRTYGMGMLVCEGRERLTVAYSEQGSLTGIACFRLEDQETFMEIESRVGRSGRSAGPSRTSWLRPSS